MSLHDFAVRFGPIALAIACCFDARAQENVTAVVTPGGEIVYYSTSVMVPQASDKIPLGVAYSELEEAVDKNAGMKDFFTSNPDLYVTTGLGDPLLTVNPNTGNVEAASAAADFAMWAAEPGNRLDTNTFLSNLAASLLDQTQKMTCLISVRPTTVEGTVSVGIVSFSANWDISKLCTE